MESFAKGEVVPTPTFPPFVANHAPPLVVSEVDEAYGKLKRVAESFHEKLALFCESNPPVLANTTEPAVILERVAFPEIIKSVEEAVAKTAKLVVVAFVVVELVAVKSLNVEIFETTRSVVEAVPDTVIAVLEA